jgi:predicted aspartyl protease
MPAITFPYISFRGIACPIIPLEVKSKPGWVRMDAYVDTGALISIFSHREAEALGIDYQRGKESFIMVGDGSYISFYSHQLTLKIGNTELQASVGFSPHLGVGFNLLGRKDIFEKFVVTFDDVKQTLTLLPRD